MGNPPGTPASRAAAATALTQQQQAAAAAAAPAAPPTIAAAPVQQASQTYLGWLAQAMGRQSTILTSGQGDTSTPSIGKPALKGTLGG